MSETRKLVIVGNGEIAAMAYEYFTYDSDYTVAGFSIESAFIEAGDFQGLPLVPIDQLETDFPPEEYNAFVAIGDHQLNRLRTQYYRSAKQIGYRMATYVSSHAFVGQNVEIGDNCFILENNTVQSHCQIGDNAILWSGNHIGHRSVVEDNVFITSHVVVSGFCRVCENSFIGVNASIANGVIIATDNYIAMGATVSQSTEPNRVYQGNPSQARKIPATRFCRVKGK